MEKPLIICIGAALVDETFKCYTEPIPGTSNPAKLYRSMGGVSRNIAHHLALLKDNVELITHFGNDDDGNWLKKECSVAGVGIKYSITNNINTGKYTTIINPKGDLHTAVVSTDFENILTPEFLETKTSLLKHASLIQIDCNLSRKSIEWIINFTQKQNIPCIIEPVSIEKAKRLKGLNLKNILLITPNTDELFSVFSESENDTKESLIKRALEEGIQYLWLREGKNGSIIYSKNKTYEKPAPKTNIIDTTGAGDAALAGWIHAYLKGKNQTESLEYANAMAKIILETEGAINFELDPELLNKNLH